MKFIDLTGRKFGRLTVKEVAGSRKGGGTLWQAVCDCGKVVVCDGANLRYGRTKSCGCKRDQGKEPRHNLSRTTTHNTWVAMRQRCNNPSNKYYVHYGYRGIQVCKRWSVFENFLMDMGEAPIGATIDRIDNDGHYEPGNCRWTDMKTQVSNRRTTLFYEYNNEKLTLKEWGDRFNIPYKVMHHRYSIGKRGEELFSPLRVITKRANP